MKKLNPCWRKDGSDFICDLPEMPKAIVISHYVSGRYGISIRGRFPFEDFEYDNRYIDPYEAIERAENVVLKFVYCFLKSTVGNTEKLIEL
jgi:hypothetical protein